MLFNAFEGSVIHLQGNYIEGERVKINDPEPRLYASHLWLSLFALKSFLPGESYFCFRNETTDAMRG